MKWGSRFMTPDRKRILITGASGGLGGALALHYASGGTSLVLGGRDRERLAATHEACASKGSSVDSATVDVTDPRAMELWLLAEDDRAPIDVVIACAGISGETGLPGDCPDLARRIIEVNVIGLQNTIDPLLPRMRQRGRGEICIVASLAGLMANRRGPAYAASKAAAIALSESWRLALEPSGINVTVACPGYIRTAMTARHGFTMPFLLSPEDAARHIAHGIAKNKARHFFPWPLAVAAFLFQTLPTRATRWLAPGPGAETRRPQP